MRKIVTWCVKHPKIINLFTVGAFLAGFLALKVLPKETFPETALDIVLVEVIYPGAGPKEIEKGVTIKIEESLMGLSGVSEVLSETRENAGSTKIKIRRGQDLDQMMTDIKDRIDKIQGFPSGMEKPRVTKLVRKIPVVDIALTGAKSRNELQSLANKLRDRFLEHSNIQQVSIIGMKNREISIEINEHSLRKYNLTVNHMVAALKKANVDISGGVVKTKKEDIRLRFYGKRYLAKELEQIVVQQLPNGKVIRVRDIASAKESYADSPQELYLNGKLAMYLRVESESGGNVLEIAKDAKQLLKETTSVLPTGIHATLQQDYTTNLKSRISILMVNGLQGLLLVLFILSFFMNVRLSFWVAMGLFFSIVGSFILSLGSGLSINMMSLFGLILVVGILVDDAIVIAENIYVHIEQGKSPEQAAIDGTMEVLPGVFTAVFTTCITFMPLFFLGGMVGKFIYMIPMVVIFALLLSLFESIVILPPHLAHSLKAKADVEKQSKLRLLINKGFDWSLHRVYSRFLRFVLKNRWPAVSASLAIFVLSIGLIQGGFVKFVFFPKIEGDRLAMRFVLKPGTPLKETRKVTKLLEEKAAKVNQELRKREGKSVIKSIVVWTGRQTAISTSFSSPRGEEVGEVQIHLVPSEERKVTMNEVAKLWQQKIGTLKNALQVSYQSMDAPPLGKPLDFQLHSNNAKELQLATQFLKKRLRSYAGVYHPEDDLKLGKNEIKMKPTSLAKSLGIPLQTIASQVRSRFYGQEVMQLQRGIDEVKVFVRYPLSNRKTVQHLHSLRVTNTDGTKIPLSLLVTWKKERELQVIRRIDRKRVASISAQLDEAKGNRQDIVRMLKVKDIPMMKAMAPSVRFVIAGQGKEQANAVGGMKVAFPIALFFIFFALVLVFQSYSQTLLVMMMIPFGLVGAILGHWLMGIPLTILSMFGIVGVSGVVVNDSIVFMEAVNRFKQQDYSLEDAVFHAAKSRYRAILSTTLTTSIGLLPILMEKSLQAQFLIPMALSLAGGVFFATLLTLGVLPAMLLVTNDLAGVYHWLRHGHRRLQTNIDSEQKLMEGRLS